MTMPIPKRWWFPVAFLLGYVGTGVVFGFRFMHVNEAIPGAWGWLYSYLVYAAVLFPIGIPGCLIWSENVFRDHGLQFALCGWLLYAGITLAGLIRPCKSLFALLVFVLVLNIAGCQPEHIHAWWSPSTDAAGGKLPPGTANE